MFGRLKDFRRIANRYDRSATNFPRRCLPRRHRQHRSSRAIDSPMYDRYWRICDIEG
jgi:hypothetical protein